MDSQHLPNILPASVLDGRTHSVETVTTDKGHGVGQDRTRDGVGRGNADTGNHGFLGLFRDDTRVQLDKVGVLVQVAQSVGNGRVAVNLFKCFVALQAEELPELIERTDIPTTRLHDTQDLNRPQGLGTIARTDGA